MYGGGNRRAGLAGTITDWSRVSDAGLAHAATYLPAGQLQQYQGIAASVQTPDVTAIAVQDGLLPASDANTNQYAPWTDALRSTGLAGAITENPALAGLFVAATVYADAFMSNAPPPQTILDNVTVPGGTPSFSTGMELPAGLPADVQAAYVASVTKYFNQLYNAHVAAENDTAQQRDNLVYLVISGARQAAMAGGTTALGNGIVVATSLIHYHVECPDGTMYVVMDDVTGDPANRYVYTWLGANWKPQAFGPGGGFVETSTGSVCTALIPGTGSWYTARVFGQVKPGDSCDGTPPNFAGPWDLITPDITAALSYQDGSQVKVVPPSQQPPPSSFQPSTSTSTAPVTATVPVTAPAPVLYQSPNAPPPTPPTATATPLIPPPTLYQPPPPVAAGAAPPPAASTTLYQDAGSVGGGGTAPTTQVVAQPASSSISGTDVLLGLVVVLGGAAWYANRKNSRAGSSWR